MTCPTPNDARVILMAGDGFTFFRLRDDSGQWKLDYQYGDGAVSTLTI